METAFARDHDHVRDNHVLAVALSRIPRGTDGVFDVKAAAQAGKAWMEAHPGVRQEPRKSAGSTVPKDLARELKRLSRRLAIVEEQVPMWAVNCAAVQQVVDELKTSLPESGRRGPGKGAPRPPPASNWPATSWEYPRRPLLPRLPVERRH